MYIGWPLLIALVVATVLLCGARRASFAAGTVLVAAAFQLTGATGTSRGILGAFAARRAAGRGRPDRAHPARPVRDRDVARRRVVVRGRARQALRRRIGTRRTVAIAVAVACLIPLVPAPQERVVRARSRSRRCSRPHCANTIPNGATVMLAPMATVGYNAAQYWQIEANMRFRQVGGYTLHAVGPRRQAVVLPVSEDVAPPVHDQLLHRRPYARPVTPAELQPPAGS